MGDGVTIVRIRGSWSAYLEAANVANDHFDTLAVGIGIVTAAAFAIGVTALPSPLAEIGWEGWIYHEMISGLAAIVTTGSETWGNAGSASFRGVIDSKAMRKIGSDEVLFGIVEVENEAGAVSAQFDARTRVLVKLP